MLYNVRLCLHIRPRMALFSCQRHITYSAARYSVLSSPRAFTTEVKNEPILREIFFNRLPTRYSFADGHDQLGPFQTFRILAISLFYFTRFGRKSETVAVLVQESRFDLFKIPFEIGMTRIEYFRLAKITRSWWPMISRQIPARYVSKELCCTHLPASRLDWSG